MNILLICNKKNLLGNKLVIDSTLYCNNQVTFFIWLTEDIGEKEKNNIQNLVSYLDFTSNVIFEEDITNPLEQHFYYLDDLLYLSADTLVAQTLENKYEMLKEDTKYSITINEITEDFTELRSPIIFFNFNNILTLKDNIVIEHNNSEIINIECNKEYVNYFTDDRIGAKGKFSFNFHMPIIFWFTNENKKIYDMNVISWCRLYPEFQPLVKQIYLAETINF